MFRKLFPAMLGLFLAFNLSTDSAISSQGENLKSEAEQKTQILRSINLFRASQKLKPLRFSKLQTEAGLAKTATGISSGGSISGRLYSEDGDFYNIGFVTAWSADSTDDSGVAMATVYPDGFYHLENLAPGEYYVLAISEGFVPMFYDNAFNFHEATLISLAEGDAIRGIDFKMQRTIPGTGSISGSVSGEFTDNTIAGAEISVWSPDNPFFYGTATTDDNGAYIITGLKTGEYYALATKEGYLTEFYENADRIYLAPHDTLTGVNFDLEVTPYYGAIAGVVTNEETGALVNRAYIEVTPTEFQLYFRPFYYWPYYAITNESGEYSLDWLPQGEYVVTVYTNGAFEYYENASSPENATMVKVTGGETTTVDFGITKKNDGPGVIAGRVYDEFHDGFLEIAIVKATPVQTELTDPYPEAIYTAVTDFEGHYEITGLPQGEFIVYAYSPHHIGEYYDSVFDPAEATIIRVEDNRISGVDFSLQPAYFLAADFRSTGGSPTVNATVLGKISDGNNSPISEAFVYLMNEDGVPVSFARSNAHGHYELSNIEQGSYKLKATHIGFRSKFSGDATSFETAEALEIMNGSYEVNLLLQSGSVTSVGGKNNYLPTTVRLYGNYPNPFNPTTQISFGLPKETEVRLSVYNLLGQKINELFSGKLGAGNHAINWNGQDNSGQFVPSGIYFYVLQSNANRLMVRKMTLLK